MAALPKLQNLRDVAAALPPGTLRPHVLLRSDAPRHGDDTPALPSWPPAVVIDLRHPDEHRTEHPWREASTVHVLPLFAKAAPTRNVGLSPDAARLAEIYRLMLTPKPAARLVEIVSLVAHAPGAALVHCAAGKDRTGVSIAFLLRLCDVPRDAVLADYLLTEAARTGIYHRLAHHYDLGGELADVAPVDVLIVAREALEAVLDDWDAHEGGTAGWYLARGGDAATLELLRRRLRP